jgi:hypothetical protein
MDLHTLIYLLRLRRRDETAFNSVRLSCVRLRLSCGDDDKMTSGDADVMYNGVRISEGAGKSVN